MPDKLRDLIVTGIPRSGTTLTAALIDAMQDSVCLNEPSWHSAKSATSAEGFAKFIADDFGVLRRKLLDGTPVQDRRSHAGKALTNYYATDRSPNHGKTIYEMVPLRRAGLSPQFTLAIKHNGPYLAVLPELIALQRFTILAIVRHPLQVIHSWRSLDLPISHGRMPNASAYWEQMAQLSKAHMDLLEKQVRMYDVMCQRVLENRQHIHLLRYEDLVQKPELLTEVTGKAPVVAPGIITPKTGLNEPGMDEIAETVRRVGVHYREFYEV